jgi:hypothetical protein
LGTLRFAHTYISAGIETIWYKIGAIVEDITAINDDKTLISDGRPPGTRTPNQRIKSPLLYQLS